MCSSDLVYRSELISYPVRYEAADPDTTRFKPLGGDRVMSLREINREHPKGIEFGHITEGFPKFPFLRDAGGGVLSYPPVINSDSIGAVEVGDTEFFVELTGTEIHSLLHATSIVACDFADLGFTVLPVKIVYPYDTPYGREMTTPFYFQKPQEVKLSAAAKLLGEEFSPPEAVRCLTRMGCPAGVKDGVVRVSPPEYRNDFLHGVDIIEDLMIGRGMKTFEPVTPADFTVGRLSDAELYGRKAMLVMVGLGFQEMIFNYLGSRKDFVERMNIPEATSCGYPIPCRKISNTSGTPYCPVSCRRKASRATRCIPTTFSRSARSPGWIRPKTTVRSPSTVSVSFPRRPRPDSTRLTDRKSVV